MMVVLYMIVHVMGFPERILAVVVGGWGGAFERWYASIFGPDYGRGEVVW